MKPCSTVLRFKPGSQILLFFASSILLLKSHAGRVPELGSSPEAPMVQAAGTSEMIVPCIPEIAFFLFFPNKKGYYFEPPFSESPPPYPILYAMAYGYLNA